MIYGVFSITTNDWLGEGQLGELVWYTEHLGLACAQAQQANKLFDELEFKPAIIGDDGQPVEIKE